LNVLSKGACSLGPMAFLIPLGNAAYLVVFASKRKPNVFIAKVV